MQTNQEIFDVVLFALREQGVASADGEACMYRGPNGTKCAAGHLIPDELYLPSMENAQFDDVCYTHCDLASLFTPDAINLITSLQTAHDACMPQPAREHGSMPHWENTMHNIARNYNLVYQPA